MYRYILKAILHCAYERKHNKVHGCWSMQRASQAEGVFIVMPTLKTSALHIKSMNEA